MSDYMKHYNHCLFSGNIKEVIRLEELNINHKDFKCNILDYNFKPCDDKDELFHQVRTILDNGYFDRNGNNAELIFYVNKVDDEYLKDDDNVKILNIFNKYFTFHDSINEDEDEYSLIELKIGKPKGHTLYTVKIECFALETKLDDIFCITDVQLSILLNAILDYDVEI